MLTDVMEHEGGTVWDFDVPFWLSNLAEQGKLTPFKGPAQWFQLLLQSLSWTANEHLQSSASDCEISSTISLPVRVKYAALIGRLRKECLSSILQNQLGGGFHSPLFRQQPVQGIPRSRKRKDPPQQ